MSEWLPIESAPKDGTEILVVWFDLGRAMQTVARWDRNVQGGWYGAMGWMVPGYQGLARCGVSPPPVYWMPLPAPPHHGSR